METLKNYVQENETRLKDLEHFDAVNDGSYEVSINNLSVADHIREQRSLMNDFYIAANDVKRETGFDALDDRVEDLGSKGGKKIGGVFHTGTKETKLDTLVAANAFTSKEGVEQFKQVSLHERIHKQAHINAEKRGGDTHIITEEFEEALCETATAQVTGEITSYQEYMPLLAQVAAGAGKSPATLSKMYRAGKFTHLNFMFMQSMVAA